MSLLERFKGMAPYRFKDNPLEKAFALAWQNHNRDWSRARTDTDDRRSTLAYLMDKDGRGEPDLPLTPRDWLVANTVIQWLGSPVGQAFLIDVLSEKAGRHVRAAMMFAFKKLP